MASDITLLSFLLLNKIMFPQVWSFKSIFRNFPLDFPKDLAVLVVPQTLLPYYHKISQLIFEMTPSRFSGLTENFM